MSLLQVEGVTKRFGGLTALSGVSLSVRAGSVVGLMGANGAGKTTLFSVIAGHQRPTAGSVSFGGRSIVGLSPDRICRLGLSRTFQIVRPFAGLTVRDNVIVSALYGSARRHSQQEAAAVADEALAALGLLDQADRPAGALTLSGQKRLEVARALGTGARLLLLDEVMAGLTPTEVEEMTAVLGTIRRERSLTFVIIEHVMGALMKLSDEILVLHHGEVIAFGTPEAIAADERVGAVYFGREA